MDHLDKNVSRLHRVRREGIILALFFSLRILASRCCQKSGERLFQDRLWKNHLLYGLLLGEIRTSNFFVFFLNLNLVFMEC